MSNPFGKYFMITSVGAHLLHYNILLPVFNNVKQPRHTARLPAAFQNTAVKVMDFSSSVEAEILPLCRSVMALAMDSPMPLPPVWRERDSSAR
jgi:hypothetical protein